jgi:hypothetical protein
VGDPITQVAPILDAAPPGTLVVSNETYKLLRGAFECRPLTKTGDDDGAAGDEGESPGGDNAKGKAAAEEVIGMLVLRRSEDFPEHLAHNIDTGGDPAQVESS